MSDRIQSEAQGLCALLLLTEEEDGLALREAARVLATGGRLALKVANGGLILNAFRETDKSAEGRAPVRSGGFAGNVGRKPDERPVTESSLG